MGRAFATPLASYLERAASFGATEATRLRQGYGVVVRATR
jgi:hypothetical protein